MNNSQTLKRKDQLKTKLINIDLSLYKKVKFRVAENEFMILG